MRPQRPGPAPARRRRGDEPAGPLLGVLAVVATGLVATGLGYWRTGAAGVGLALLVAAVLRVVLPDQRAGLLAVRGRRLDAAVLLLAGAALIVLALSVPAPEVPGA